ncbi:MAG: hypothetical protein IJ532_02755 [Alphaproteobacteria bacterium]|nr:hypothetical protein [Alphaproteobacteria bacterium]
MIFTFIIFITPCVWGQIVKRTAKAPSFFVPNGSLKAKTDAEKLSATKKPAYARGRTAHIEKDAGNYVAYPDIQYEKAPIDEILRKQKNFSAADISNYRQNIVKGFTLYSAELDKLMQYEYEKVNRETLRMNAALEYIKIASSAYRLANFQLDTQISQDMIKSRKHYKKIKQKLTEIISEQKNKKIYIIEAKNSMFWMRYEVLRKAINSFNIKGENYHFKDVTYISIFDNKYNHLFSYYRQHINMLKNRRIPAADRTSDFNINHNAVNIYQQLFDDYINDLNRIGKGLDINNPKLLRQLDEMQDKTISM